MQRMRQLFILISAGLMAFSMQLSANEDVVKYPRQDEGDTRDLHKIDLLESVLKITSKEYGKVTLIPSRNVMSEARMVNVLKYQGDEIDVIFKPTTIEREQILTPVRIPILKGLLGYRISLIHQDMQKQFSQIKNLQQLQKYLVGQGQGWGDVAIFEHNGIEVVKAPYYEGLFKMLILGRFDFFSRGITEAPYEWEERKRTLPELHMEESILLHYYWPVYYFTAKNEKGKKLAERIRKGLEALIENGKFDQIFDRYYRGLLEKVNLKNRTVIELENPTLPKETPIDNKKYWLDIQKYIH